MSDSLLRVVDTVTIAETVRVSCDTVRIAGKVIAETAKWWPLVYAGLGTLAGAIVGAIINFLFNRSLERERRAQARALFTWQRDIDAGYRALSSALEYMTDVRLLRDQLADVPIPEDNSPGISSGHRADLSRRFSQVRLFAAQTQQKGGLLSTLSLLPGMHYNVLQSRIGAIQDQGMKFAEDFTKLVRIVDAWLAGSSSKETSDVPSLRDGCMSICDKISDETMKLYLELFAAVRPGAKLAEDGTLTWPDTV